MRAVHNGLGGVSGLGLRLVAAGMVLLGCGVPAGLMPSAVAQAAPQLVSVTPANGTTGVGVGSPITFTFNEPMSVFVPPMPSVPPFFVGNYELTPADEIYVDPEWSEDGRTLTFTPSGDLPANTTIGWKLNPAGSILPFTSAGGTPLATVSGSFQTGSGGGGNGGDDDPPELVSVSPLSGATGVSVATSVVFVFDQPMQKNPLLGGFPPMVPGAIRWVIPGGNASQFTYQWSADGRVLTCDYAGDLPGNTRVEWTLNPGGTDILLESETGEPLPENQYAGHFTTGEGGGGNGDCEPDGIPSTWGSYSVVKMGRFVQTSPADPVAVAETPFAFMTMVMGPQGGPAPTAGSITLPGGTQHNLELVPFVQMLTFMDTPATSEALDAAYPAGNYTLRFTRSGEAERSFTLPMAAGNPPVPKVGNQAETQNVNAAQDFTLRWNSFTGASASDFISLFIYNRIGDEVFQAPDLCVPRELPVSATSIVIPANTLQPNRTYDATLTFGRLFYFSTNSVPEMAGSGVVGRSTEFTIRTGTGGGGGDPARFTGFRLLPNGNPELTVTGTTGRTYTIQRSSQVASANWASAGTVTMSGAGTAVFEDTQPGKTFPLFYRAITD